MNFAESVDADIPTFFSTDEFAVQALVNGQPVNGYFDPGSEGNREERSPGFTCADADIRAAPYGSPVVINDVNYWLEAYQPDGHGLALLILRPTQWPPS